MEYSTHAEMDPDLDTKPDTQTNAQEHVFPRDLERAALWKALPITGTDNKSKRVFNVWGEKGVGKTHFITSLRESEDMKAKKVLWLSTGFNGTVDSVQEFITDCAQSVRYPMTPKKEKSISERIERAQRGKANPMKSDDDLLITRSSIAKQKKPYINQAAAASVGRTEIIREEIQLDVGFEKNELSSQAEAFLDALPLQSLGTDLIALHIQSIENISITVRDWLKDYLIPSATKGSFRRSLIFIVESSEPSKYHHDSISWGPWDELLFDYRLRPLSEDVTCATALSASLPPPLARFIQTKSQGYPRQAADLITAAQNGAYTSNLRSATVTLLSSMQPNERAKLAACCLPDKLYPDELDALFGKGNGEATLKWISGYKQVPLHKDTSGDAIVIEDDFRHVALDTLREDTEFLRYRSRWSPYGRLTKFVPDKTHRSKILLLSGLNWIDKFACKALFGDKAETVLHFTEEDEAHFIRKRGYHRLSTCLLEDASSVARSMSHVGITQIEKNAIQIWTQRSRELGQKAQELKASLTATQDELNIYTRRHNESTTQLKKLGKVSGPTFNERSITLAHQKPKLKLLFLLAIGSAASFTVSQFLPSPSNIMPNVAGIAALFVSLSLIPGIINHYKAKAQLRRSLQKDSPEHLHKENIQLHNEMKRREVELEDLHQELADTLRALEFAYVT